MSDEEVASLREQVKQLKDDMARQKSEYVQKIRDMEKRHAEDAEMNANVDADDVQDAAEFEAQCDMLELSLADKIDKLAAANTTIEELRNEILAKEAANQQLRDELAGQAAKVAEAQAKAEEAAKELEANTKLTRQYKASLDKIRAQQETRIAELKRSHEHEMHVLQEHHSEEQARWAADLRAATERFSTQRDALHAQISKLQGELAAREAQVQDLEQRIEYLENADHVAEMLAANRKYKAALGIIEQLKGQIELLNCRIAETEKLLTVEKRRSATLQQQLVAAQRAANDALAAAATMNSNGSSGGGGTFQDASSSSSSNALANFVGQALRSPRVGLSSSGGSRRALSGGASAVTTPSIVRSGQGGQRIRVKQMEVHEGDSPDHLRTVHVQSGAVPQADRGNVAGGEAAAQFESTPLQALATTRAEVSFVQNLELRLQKSRAENTRLVEEVQRLKKRVVTVAASKDAAIAAAAAEAEANARCATCGRNAEEAADFERQEEEARRAAEEEEARAAAEAEAEEAARRFAEEHDFGQQDEEVLQRPVASMGVVTMKPPAAVALESDARAAEAAAAHAKAAAEAAAVAAAMIQFRGVQVSGPQTQAALLMPPGLRITSDLPPGQGRGSDEDGDTLAITDTEDGQFVVVSHADNSRARARAGSSNADRPAQLTSPERAAVGGPRRYIPPATSTTLTRRAAGSALETPPGLDVARSYLRVGDGDDAGVGTQGVIEESEQVPEEDDASFRARRRHRLWELVGAGM
eukprot:INCI6747.1.p1 GENE.INCI6747.1~~INCI6747.1.p1  ORF type:complete len:880 (-),score=223.87 INCI6747.1:168-2441(-)